MLSAPRTYYRTCSLCEAMCGLTLTVAENEIASVRGDDDDPFSRGYICPKGVAIAALHSDPDRLRHPLRRNGSRWDPIRWDEALDEVAQRIHALQAKHGNHSIAAYIGNPAVHNTGSLLYGPSFLRTLASRHRYSATSVDQLPQMLAAYLMYGHQLLMPVPDVDRTSHMLILGGNPLVSGGSIMSAPDMKRRLAAIRSRNGKVIVIDPRRTETADVADEHIFVRPGTDALLLAAITQTLLATNHTNLRNHTNYTRNLDQLRTAVADFTPERVADPTGIPATTIRRLAHELTTATAPVVYGRVGISMHPHGGICHWLVNAINVLIGALDHPGGAMFSLPAFDIVGSPPPLGLGAGSFGRWRSKVRNLPEFGGELPVATLAEDIEAGWAGGEDPIRGLLTIAGNPVLSTPNGLRLDAALARLDFVVSIDFYLNETTRHAHLILPPTGPLEHGHYDVALHTVAVRNTVKYSPAVFPKTTDQRHDHEILVGLERRLLALRKASLPARLEAKLREQLGPERILALGLRAGPYSFGGGLRQGLTGLTWKQIEAAPHGIDLGPLQPCLPARLPKRRDGRPPHIDLAPAELVADIPRLRALLDDAPHDPFLLIGRRQLRNNNSWMHNVPKLMTGKPRCTLLVHPTDATKLRITDGADVRVTSRTGSIVAPVEITDAIMPGVVSLPHGFGHDRQGTTQRVAAAHAGVSINDLTDEQRIDTLSGVAAFSGVPVAIEAV